MELTINKEVKSGFVLVEGKLKGNFDVLKSSEMVHDSIRIEANVIEGGHKISLYFSDGYEFHEVLKRIGKEDYDDDVVSPCFLVPARSEAKFSRVSHRFESTFGEFTGRSYYDQIVKDLASYAKTSDLGIVFDFPVEAGGGNSPRTVIALNWNKGIGSFVVNTAHTFPQKGRIVLTTSSIKPK